MIRTNEDLRTSYTTVKLLDEMVQKMKKVLNNVDPEIYGTASGYVIGIKAEIRTYNKRKSDRRIIRGVNDYESYIELIELPDFIENEKEAEEYFEEEEYMNCIPSQYDCTGRPFTGWVKIFQRRGKWMAYHRVEFDV